MQAMTDPLTISLAITVGFQSGLMASWRYYKRQRDDQDAMRRQYESRIEALERDLNQRRRLP